MRLITLEILNLASLDRNEGEVIHFEEGVLKDSTIFSIVGPTGSGKSTILDAICLALYNRAPRYPRKKGERNQNIEVYGDPDEAESHRLAPTDSRNILTRGKRVGYSKLTFWANNGMLYRAEWHVKFNRVKFDPARTCLYKIGEVNGNTVEEVADWDTLPQIIGLDYDQFLRTVLIAQGSFANFLTAKENERSELLEKLIGCEELYTGIAARIREKRDEAARGFEQINTIFSTYEKDLIPADEQQALNDRIAYLEAEEKKVRGELLRMDEALKWYVADDKYQKDIERYTEELRQSELAIETFAPYIQRLELYDKTLEATSILRDIKYTEAAINKQRDECNRLEIGIGKQEIGIQNEEQKLKSCKEEAQVAVLKLEEQKPRINRARILQGELDVARRLVKQKQEAQATSEKGLKAAQQMLNLNLQQIQLASMRLQQAQNTYRELCEQIERQKQVNATQVKKAVDEFTQQNIKLNNADADSLQRNKDDAERKLNHWQNAIRLCKGIANKQQMIQHHEREIHKLEERNLWLQSELAKLNVDALTHELEVQRKAYTLLTSEKWAMHRHLLEDGKPCPLCGATQHPFKHDDELQPLVSEMSELIEQKKMLLNTQVERQKQLTSEQSENKGKLDSMVLNNRVLHTELLQLRNEWTEIHQQYPDWSDKVEVFETGLSRVKDEAEKASKALTNHHNLLKNVSELRRVKEECEQKQLQFVENSDKQLRQAELQQKDADLYLQTEKGKTENLQSQVNEKLLEFNQVKSECEEATGSVTAKCEAMHREIGDRTPDAWENQLNAARNLAQQKLERQTESVASLREYLKGLHGQKEAAEKSLESELQNLEVKNGRLDNWLANYNEQKPEAPLTRECIVQIYEATDNWREIRQKKENLNTLYTQRKTTLHNTIQARNDHRQQKPEKEYNEIWAKKAELEQFSNEELTNAKARKQRHERARQEMGMMFDQREQAETLKTEWQEIVEAIGGEGTKLRQIAQCYTLRFLIEYANVEIRKFNTRYELQQVRNSLGIRVIDHDRADDVRDTTSLSGGETFIVSLGLALGLSTLSSRNISFDNLFIDEGFGTLDPETLATVIDSLAMLQSSQGKKVGVISHTDTMSERITTQIRIIKNGHSGSSRIEVYP